MEITGAIKNYDWGKLGYNSEVAKLAKLNVTDLPVSDETPYAELWMGDHPSGSSKVKATGEELGAVISKNPVELNGGEERLPFLFKVLSVRKALSIQVHPNKSEAEKLHRQFPEIYKDPNHKPELAIALTPFIALCGFRPRAEILSLVRAIHPLTQLIGKENVNKLENGPEGIKSCFSTLMHATEKQVVNCIDEILKEYVEELRENKLYDIFVTVHSDFPKDVGVLCVMFLNVIRLDAGDAIFLPANEPHAYLSGDCIECMACSDNVIRAGLTPKFKDVSTLIRLLNYEDLPIEKKLYHSIKKDDFLQVFTPPVKDFAVAKLYLPAKENNYRWKNKGSGSILLVLKGKRSLTTEKFSALTVSRGSIVFIPSNCNNVEFVAIPDSTEDFEGYIAMNNNY